MVLIRLSGKPSWTSQLLCGNLGSSVSPFQSGQTVNVAASRPRLNFRRRITCGAEKRTPGSGGIMQNAQRFGNSESTGADGGRTTKERKDGLDSGAMKWATKRHKRRNDIELLW